MQNIFKKLEKVGQVTVMETMKVVLIERPQRYFTETGDREFLCLMQQVASSAFGIDIDLGGADGVYSHVITVDILSIAYNDQAIMGFASVNLLPHLQTLFLQGVAIAPLFQNYGLAKKLVKPILAKFATWKYASCTTQNPIVYLLFQQLCQSLYPETQSPIPPEITSLAIKIMPHRLNQLGLNNLTIKNFYDSCMYRQIPKVPNHVINELFARALNIRNGTSRDAFLLIGKL